MNPQNKYEQENEQKRAQWREEVRQMREEEEQKYFKVEKSFAPLLTVVSFCCFAAYGLFGGFIDLGSYAFYSLWFGSLAVILRYSIKLHRTLDKVCIGMLVCTVFAVMFDILGNAHLLEDSSAQVCVLLYQIFCIVGAGCSVFAMIGFWKNRKQIKEMEVNNPWSK